MASSSFLYDNGKVLGCSSMLFNTFTNPTVFNVPVMAGLLASAFTVSKFLPQFMPDYSALAPSSAAFGAFTIPIAGLLVGIGTKLGSGCTSGHILCGLARRAVRSLVAVCTFTSVAVLTTNILDTAPSCGDVPCHTVVAPSAGEVNLLLSVLGTVFVTRFLLQKFLYKQDSKLSQTVASLFSGFTFGLGLLVSGMASPGTTLGFLAVFPPKFNPSLLMVMAFGLAPNVLEYTLRGVENPCTSCVTGFDLPTKTEIDYKLVVGSAIFGLGWGLSGICPGPGVLSVALNGSNGLVWLGTFLAGYFGATACF